NRGRAGTQRGPRRWRTIDLRAGRGAADGAAVFLVLKTNPMRRASEIRAAGTWNAASAIDRVVADAAEGPRPRIPLTGERGPAFLLDLPHATALKDGDGLVLEDGAIVR